MKSKEEEAMLARVRNRTRRANLSRLAQGRSLIVGPVWFLAVLIFVFMSPANRGMIWTGALILVAITFGALHILAHSVDEHEKRLEEIERRLSEKRT